MKKISISKKIWLSISILIIGYASATLLSILTGKSTNDQLRLTSEYIFPAFNLAQTSATLFKTQIDAYSDAIMFGEVDSIDEASAMAEAISTKLNKISALPGISPQELATIATLRDELAAFSSNAEALYTGWIQAETNGEDTDTYMQKVADLGGITEDLTSRISGLTTSYEESLHSKIMAASTRVQRSVTVSLILFLSIVIISIAVISLIIVISITKPIHRIVTNLSTASSHVGNSAAEISGANQTLAESCSNQAASIEETSSSLEEMSSMTKQNAVHTDHANTLMNTTNEAVNHARTAMSQLSTSMKEIAVASDKTSKIIKTIDEIAFQTNLLALNAAVEAARAGTAGAGFAVVADEVRNLALRSAEAAKDTTKLIESTSAKVRDGQSYVERTNTAFISVAESSAEVSDLIQKVSVASEEQSTGIDEVNRSTCTIDQGIQTMAASTEESAAVAKKLEQEAVTMTGVIQELVELMNGG